ncbi:MAG TPA: ISL3 family transposase [Candidatus Nitrosocosmicus sp.]|nr:ISL3 family transposase [Candidatus Nitrosocosmicus sp.]
MRYEDTEGLSILYDAVASKRPNFCTNPKCGHFIKPHVHSSKTNIIKDIKSEGKIVVIRLKINRYRCPDCKYVFPDEFTFYEKDEHLTKRLKQEFVKRCIDGETFRYIGNAYGVDGKTVAEAFNVYADAHRDDSVLTYTPIILGIDEAHIDDHYRLVLTDIYNQKLIDIKKNNYKGTVKAYLRTLDKNICKCVTMDFAEGYAACVEKVLPDAVIVIDKYHIVQLINRSVDKVRIDLQNYYRSKGCDIRVFKHSKKLFMTNWEDLTPEAVDAMNKWFIAFPELYDAYMVKETFRDIYATAKNYGEALKMFNDWLYAIPPMKQFETMKKTFTDRKTHILNYWSYRWTNAFTESTNNAIKKIEKAGRGYKFDVLRDRCMLSINNPKPEKFKYKNASYVKKVNKTQQEKVDSLYDIAFMFDNALSSIPIRMEGEPAPDNLPFSPAEHTRMVDFLQRIARTSLGREPV